MGGHKYTAPELDPLAQIHIARRLAPIILGALKPEGGRKAILARLAKFANLASAEGEGQSALAENDQIIADAMDLATSILEAAASSNEDSVNFIIRECAARIFRMREGGGGLPIWPKGQEYPSYRDIDGFTLFGLVCRYLFLEYREPIAEYIASLNLAPGPALAAAVAGAPRERPPGAPEAR
ncbi:phage tail assembly chaperone [Methylobacterium sp. SI9]|uniref:phage tail assembly chaperone n=1 Tax=Methylobacterium guangdongense TaxID=3138811 RepID=UPI00313F0F45